MKPTGKAAAAALAATLTMITAACGGGDSAVDADGPVQGTVQLSYWGSSTRVEKTNKILPLFKKKYPKVTVQPQVTDFDTFFQKLNVQAASKSMPCIAGMQTRQLNDYTTNDTLLPLDELVETGKINVDDIPKTVLDSGRGPDGKLYMIPYGVAWNAFFVNKTAAAKHDVEPLPQSYSWDDLESWLTEAKEKVPDGVAPVSETGSVEALFSAYVLGNGKKMFNEQGKIGFDKQTLIDYWTMWEGWRKAGLTNSMQNAVSEPGQIEQHSVISGKVLMQAEAGNAFVAASKAAPDDEFVELPFPEGSAGNGNMFFTSGWSIPKNCDNQAAAAAFIDFWTNDDQAADIYLSDNGAVANQRQLKDQIADPDSAELKVVLQTYEYILEQEVPNPVIPPGYNAVFQQAFQREYENVAFGKKTIPQAVDAFFEDANASLGGD